MDTKKIHSLHIEETKLSIGGIEKVLSSNDKLIAVKLPSKMLTIDGTDFNIDKLDLEEGKLIATGHIKEIRYSNAAEKQAFFKKLFK